MKKQLWRRLGAAALALALTLGLGQTAFASWALGTELIDRTVELAKGVSLTNTSLWSASKSDLRTEHYITYTPGGGVVPMVYSGAYVASRNTVAAAASALEGQGYRVVAGVNGGFFNGDGTIVGVLMTEGVVRSLDVENYALLGFDRDGRVFVDESRPAKAVSWEASDGAGGSVSHSYALAGFNAYRNNNYLGGLYLYNQDFSAQVNKDASRNCVAVVLTPVSRGGVILNGSLTLAVESVTDTGAGGAFNGKLPQGRYMLYANYYDGNEALLNGLRSLTPGQQVTVTVSGVSSQWTNAVYGISGLYTLLRGGNIVSGLPAATNPYTAIGIKADGTTIFYTIDGRQNGYSVGATYAQVAERLQELGCVTAVALDGGGSTTLGATLPGRQKFEILNQPSQNGRAVNNSIFLVTGSGYGGMASGFYLDSYTQTVLVGASLRVTATGYDQWGRPASGMTPAWSATGGTVSGGLTAIYTAGRTAGLYSISAGSGSALPVRVVDNLSSLTVTREGSSASVSSLSLKAGDVVDLTASGRRYNLAVAMGDENVTWAVSGNIGTIDAKGRFTAGTASGSGKITASAGGRTVTISVTVAGLSFADVPASGWYTDAVRYVVDKGLMDGTSATKFSPMMTTTRGMVMTILARSAGVDTSGGSTWYEKGMAWAVSRGISDGKAPETVITREQLAVMLWRYLGQPAANASSLSGYSDSRSVSSWARDGMAWAVANGIVQGSGSNLRPQGTATRAETAVMLARFCQTFLNK